MKREIDHYADGMIAHRWFAKHFGAVYNGKDFAIKCEMADREMAALRGVLHAIANLIEECPGHEITIARRRDGKIWISTVDGQAVSGEDIESACAGLHGVQPTPGPQHF